LNFFIYLHDLLLISHKQKIMPHLPQPLQKRLLLFFSAVLTLFFNNCSDPPVNNASGIPELPDSILSSQKEGDSVKISVSSNPTTPATVTAQRPAAPISSANNKENPIQPSEKNTPSASPPDKPATIPEEPAACHTIQAILKNAFFCKDKLVELNGKVCLAQECRFIAPAASQPYSRSSWPFKQGAYCIYVFGGQPEADEDANLTLKAYVRIINEQLYLQMQP
jgi:hypothetical protein